MLGKFKAIGIVAALALAACSGGGGGSGSSSPLPPGGYNGSCDPGTAVSLANPTPNSSGNSTTIGSIAIVANGNNNTLGTTYSGWTLVLQPNYNSNPVYSGSLNLVPKGASGWSAPYGSNYFYSASIPQLQFGTNYTVYLANNGCNGVAIGNFST